MGRGKFGTVYHVVGRKDGISYASKHVKYRNLEAKQKIIAEVDLMRKLNHPRLVKMIEAFQGEREIVVVMEHLAGGELFDLVADEEFQLTEGQVKRIIKKNDNEYLQKKLQKLFLTDRVTGWQLDFTLPKLPYSFYGRLHAHHQTFFISFLFLKMVLSIC